MSDRWSCARWMLVAAMCSTVASASCRERAAPPRPPAAPMVRSAPSDAALSRQSRDSGGATAEVCASFIAEQQALATNWRDPSYLPPVLGQCYSTRRGAWAYAFDSFGSDPEVGSLVAHFSIVHLELGDGGVRLVAASFVKSPLDGISGAPPMPAPLNYILQPGAYYTDVFAPKLYDYDGDGEEEILASMQAYMNEGDGGATGQVLTFKQGTASAYPPARAIVWRSVEDVDNDGRPDLVGVYLNVAVVAHALADGTFSRSDGPAASYAERACPPGRDAVFLPVAEPGGSAGHAPTGWNGACARLWGATEAQVLAEIDRHCGTGSKRCEVKSDLTDDFVESKLTYQRDARVAPPLVLRSHRP